MPDLDVSQVLDDPMFNKIIQVVRTNRSVKHLGKVVPQYTIISTIAVLEPIRGEALNRLAPADRSRSPITAWTKYPLSAGNKDWGPDEIRYRNKIWQVQEVFDWSDYGEGFTKAVCIEKDPTV